MHRVPVREDRHQLLAVHPRPVAGVADVEMHEGRAGLGIIADAADLHLQADLAQLGQRHVRNVEVERLAERVLALLGDARAARAQHRIGRRRAIAGDDIDEGVGAALAIRLPDQVQEPRVDLGLLALAPVAQEPVDLLELAAVVAAVALVGEAALLLGMQIVELQDAGLGLRRGDRAADQQSQGSERREAPCRAAGASGMSEHAVSSPQNTCLPVGRIRRYGQPR